MRAKNTEVNIGYFDQIWTYFLWMPIFGLAAIIRHSNSLRWPQLAKNIDTNFMCQILAWLVDGTGAFGEETKKKPNMPLGRTVGREQKTSASGEKKFQENKSPSRCQVEPDNNQNSAGGPRWTVDGGNDRRRSQQEPRGSSALGRRNELPLTAQCNQGGKQERRCRKKSFCWQQDPKEDGGLGGRVYLSAQLRLRSRAPNAARANML